MKQIINRVLGSALLLAALLIPTSCSEDTKSYYKLNFPSSVSITFEDDWASKVYYDSFNAMTVVPLYVGMSESVQLGYDYVADAEVQNQNWVWASNNENVAIVDENGCVYPVSAGTATITVSLYPSALTSNHNSSVLVTVAEKFVAAQSVDVSSATVDYIFEGGSTLQLTAAAVTASGDAATYNTFEWTSSNTALATIDAISGVITSCESVDSDTSVTFTAAAVDGSGAKGSIDVKVHKDLLPTSVTIDAISKSTYGNTSMPYTDRSFQIEYTMDPVDANPYRIDWTTSNGSILTVDELGKVTIVGRGSNVSITASCDEGKSTDKIEGISIPAGWFREMFTEEKGVMTDYLFSISTANASTGEAFSWDPNGYASITTYTATAELQRQEVYSNDLEATGFNIDNYPYLVIHQNHIEYMDLPNGATVLRMNRVPRLTINGATPTINFNSATGSPYNFGSDPATDETYDAGTNAYITYIDTTSKDTNRSGLYVIDLRMIESNFPSVGKDDVVVTTLVNWRQANIEAAGNANITYNLYSIQTFATMEDIVAYAKAWTKPTAE